MNYKWLFILLIAVQPFQSFSQKHQSSSNILMKIEKLNVLGSVLYFAAHPDDENTRLIAWLASDRNYRTSYLSLTRGDGGQNLIGSQLGIDLGLIRTQELLAARKIDGGEQYFSSAYDFGFSKTHEETFRFWDKNEILKEAVWLIRKLRPDVIINRFPPDPRGGHGHHQASAILAHEAFVAAADPKKFPEQLTKVQVWKAKRIVWNTANFGGANNTSEDQLKIDIGRYNPLVGQSYGEVAAASRSQHKSQGFGSATSRGQSFEYFEHVAGQPAREDLFDDINTTWSRIGETADIQQLIAKIKSDFDYLAPQKSINDLIKLYTMVEKVKDAYWRDQKLKEIKTILSDCAGLWIQSTAQRTKYTTDENFDVRNDIIVRNPNTTIKVLRIHGQNIEQNLSPNKTSTFTSSYIHPQITQPYWLKTSPALGRFKVEEENYGYAENQDQPRISFDLEINRHVFHFEKAIQYNYVDPVHGEVHVPLSITPAITAKSESPIVMLTNSQAKSLQVTFTNHHKTKKHYKISVKQPANVQISPASFDLQFENDDQKKTLTFEISSKTDLLEPASIVFEVDGEQIKSLQELKYDHIPTITWFPECKISVQPLSIDIPIQRVGYIAGAGDLIPESLRSIGIDVEVIHPNQLSLEKIKNLEAIIFGIRALNIHAELYEHRALLNKYVEDGGVVLYQYHVNSIDTRNLGPYPFSLSRTRVTEEDAKVTFDQKDQDMIYPNKITERDFDGWIQERGLYFAQNIDSKYRTPLSLHDKNESPSNGSLLIGDYGKGKFVYTSLAFFRQLPAGVPGAYRLFVNLLTIEKSKK